MQREFTGRHMALVLVAGFGIVVAVNFYMASLAIGGFGGVVVENSYVASQKFNGWLEQARVSDRLGYAAALGRDAEGRLVATTERVPQGALLSADLRRPLGRPDHFSLRFEQIGPDRFVSTRSLPEGRWVVRLAIDAGGGRWVEESEVP
ncbi:FixH family protein [Qipengyuania sp.]|uniref:FixH family protein n=1 Tax=Qipengyuania sp. TaxID=2004515 RepID=UPI003AF801ED